MMQLVMKIFRPIMLNQFNIPTRLFDFIMAVFVFLKGYSDDFSFDDPNQATLAKLSTNSFLGKTFGIFP